MIEKQKKNIVYSNYYFHLHKETEEPEYGRFYKKSIRIRDCMDLWIWDKYEKNKLLDLQKVNLCNDRNCPNCRTLNVAKALHNFKPGFREMLKQGYNPYLLTLTVPNVPGPLLKETIDKMTKKFAKFWVWYFNKIGKGQKGFNGRMFDMMACVKVIEINVQKTNHDMYHPHFHLIVFIKDEEPDEIEKIIDGGYQIKSKQHKFYSYADLQIMILWKMAYDSLKLSEMSYKAMEDIFEENYTEWQNNRNYEHPVNTWCGLYLCDLTPLRDEKGLYEVFKYPFKDTDLHNYNNFKYIFKALDGKRIRQGHGELYNLKLDEEPGELQDLEEFLSEKESPQEIILKELKSLITDYHEYRKISRFKAYSQEDFENIR
jgi:plasmid rolling circle replication initiator protein Rep